MMMADSPLDKSILNENGKGGFIFNDGFALCRGDSLEVLKSIADESIDCIVTDPPYFIDGMGNGWNLDDLNRKSQKAAVIGSLPTGMKFDPEQGRMLQDFMLRVSKEAFRILKPGAFYLSFSQGRLYHRMAVAMEDAGFEIRDMLVWKREGQPKAFSQDHFVRKMQIPEEEKERMLKSLNGRKTPQLKGQSEPICLAQKPRDGTFVENWLKHGVGLIDVGQSLDGKFPGTVMDVPKPRGEERKRVQHFTLKPVALIEHMVRVFTKEGDVVLDPFMGSGTTGEACLKSSRRFVGVELNEEYFKVSENRLAELKL